MQNQAPHPTRYSGASHSSRAPSPIGRTLRRATFEIRRFLARRTEPLNLVSAVERDMGYLMCIGLFVFFFPFVFWLLMSVFDTFTGG